MILRVPLWTILRRLTALAFLVLLTLAGHNQLDWLEGSAIATRFGSTLRFIDPLAALETAAARHELTADLLKGTGLLVLSALILGPIFCSWFCPLGLVLDINDSLRRLLIGAPRRRSHASETRFRGSRLLVLGLVLGLCATTGRLIFTPLSPIQMVVSVWVTGSMLAVSVVAALMVTEWFFPRLWCRRLCPLGGLYTLLGRPAILRIRIDQARAGNAPCGLCTLHCPMGIRVMEDHTLRGKPTIDDPACTRCGSCIDVCRQEYLSFTPAHATPSGGESAKRPNTAA